MYCACGGTGVHGYGIYGTEMKGVSRFIITAKLLCLIVCYLNHVANGSLIASSEVQMCSRDSPNVEPIHASGEHCSKKFVVSLAVRNGQVSNTV